MNRIAVITRTKNRPLLLRRCMASLLNQTYKDFVWAIVNDNGPKEDVEIVAAIARREGLSTLVIHRHESAGVAAAANDGILQTASEFIHIHDDDDTVEPDFYESMIKFLDGQKKYMGVVCCGNRIEEEIYGECVSIKRKYPFYNYDGAIYIADLLWKNQFTTNSFLYRRSVFEIIGLYDESLPVLEDWEFNLRFLMKFDIGVLSRFLANYHWRINLNSAGTAQTVTAGAHMHQEYTALIRNKFIRLDVEGGNSGLGVLMTLGRFHQLQSNTLKDLNDQVGAQLIFRKFVKNSLRLIGIKRR